jgi:hypothetical protein
VIVLDNSDSVRCNSETIVFQVKNNVFEYELEYIEKISILTTDRGPFEDDVAMAIFLPSEIYIIKSELDLYQNLLFEQLGKYFSLDYQSIIESCSSMVNAEFIIFTK